MNRISDTTKEAFRLAVLALLAVAPAAAQAPRHEHYTKPEHFAEPAASGALAPRLQNLGNHTFPVTTKSHQAQLYVNQGINLTYGFNHAEAGRSFREAERLDPNCAMAVWGQALVLGPNLNAPMFPEAEPEALKLVQKAMAMKDKASPREQMLIEALAARYSGDPKDRVARDREYADAMRKVYQKYPNDLEVATMFAEAMMDLRPWGYWNRDGFPYPGTEELVTVLEKVLAKNPKHPGATHLYIHAMEGTKTPEKAEAAADTLSTLMPGAGHMVHMPGHIYQRVGRYADAAKANVLAIAADEDYISQCQAQGLYPLGYYPHNIHFLWWAATNEGRSQVAIEAARKVVSKTPPDALKVAPFVQAFLITPYYALVRFGKWEEMLKEPAPPAGFPFMEAIWHYGRGISFTRTGQTNEAEKELARLT
ncbi:MAG: hypothetical protein HY046_09335, partial [Acidobacteria bacterium]|nr:hypothetical protein [Acidobacteriota bacterium]